MSTPELIEFAKVLVQYVRACAIDLGGPPADDCCGDLEGRQADEKAAANGDFEALTEYITPEIVDHAMFYILFAVDEGALHLSFTASNGKSVDLMKDEHSELAGWYAGSPSWRDEFTQERFMGENIWFDDSFQNFSDFDE